MEITRDTIVQIHNEGIYTITYIVEFEKDTVKQISYNLRRPSGRITDPTPGAAEGSTISYPNSCVWCKFSKVSPHCMWLN